MNSCIYQGEVIHQRRHPVEHRFRFRLYLMLLDLAELPSLFRNRWLWSTSIPNFAWFRRRDHLKAFHKPGIRQTFREQVIAALNQHGIDRSIGSIRLLTQLRYAFFAMNPVSFFYCYSEDGRDLEAVIVEVNNTPWGEQHCYVIDARAELAPTPAGPNGRSTRESNRRIRANNVRKAFHVSPFMSLNMHYQMRIGVPSDQLSIQIANTKQGKPLFAASMRLQRQKITARSLAGCLIRQPLITLRIFASIYWHAFRLFCKGTPVFRHPKKQHKQSPKQNCVRETR